MRYTIDMSPEFSQTLEDLSRKSKASKADVLRRALALLKVAEEAKAEGKRFGVAEKDGQLSKEIVGI